MMIFRYGQYHQRLDQEITYIFIYLMGFAKSVILKERCARFNEHIQMKLLKPLS